MGGVVPLSVLGVSLLPWTGLQLCFPCACQESEGCLWKGSQRLLYGVWAPQSPSVFWFPGWAAQAPGGDDSEGEEEALAWIWVLLVAGPWWGHCPGFSLFGMLTSCPPPPLLPNQGLCVGLLPLALTRGTSVCAVSVVCRLRVWRWHLLNFAPDVGLSWMPSLFPRSSVWRGDGHGNRNSVLC